MTASARNTIVPVVVLNWNGLNDTINCIDHLLAAKDVSLRVILVDNASDGDDYDQLKARYGDNRLVELRRNPENLGFALGMNRILAELLATGPEQRPRYVALLNNDAFPEPGWLAALVEAAESTGAGAVASRMLRYDNPGLLDNAGHVFLNTGEVLPRGSAEPAATFSEPADVEGSCGGACLLRLDMLQDIGLFDAFYSTGYEDAELGLRAWLAGYRQVYQPAAQIRHKVGASIDKIRDLDYAVTLQVNIHYAYFKLMPASVIFWNMPWIMLKTLGMLIVPALTGRWRLLKVQWLALWRTAARWPEIRRARSNRAPIRIRRREILRRQEFFLGRYWRYFRRFVLGREKTIFER
ncbi:glycosyltransferase [Wenzhouxiangella limi]|uniref:Glycosyltransferase family 2 protein n=1 Tax=Wenzhouxiangella limi TaxID=2707351 RepID=A0A845V0N9_9GAMM|nr:glycosyltransferase family 2 protein [Wenzhouxiangella limi]